MIVGNDLGDVRGAKLASSTISAEGEVISLKPHCCTHCAGSLGVASRGARRAWRLPV